MENTGNKTLTVLVITTNRERTIIATLDSIRSNHDKSLSVKLYDFCSDDRTVLLVKDYILKLGLDWSYEVSTSKLRDCEDWQYVLENEEDGWITFLEGDDIWPEGFCTKVFEIINMNPTVGLIHFSGTNEKGFRSNGYDRDNLFRSFDYVDHNLVNKLAESYAPSQTVFKKNSKGEKTTFDISRFHYAPEPSLWLKISLKYDVYICASMAVYRGISDAPKVKLDAAIDLLSYAEDLIIIKPEKKFTIFLQASLYLLNYHYLAYFYSLIRLRQRISLDYIIKPVSAYTRLLMRNLAK